MARFGLDESESESEASSSTSSPPPPTRSNTTPIRRPLNKSQSRAALHSESEEDEDSAPPRASLMSEDEEEQGDSDDEEEEEEEDESIMEDEDSVVNKSSYEPTEDGDDDEDDTESQRGFSSGHSPTPSPPRTHRSKPTGTPLAVKTNLIPTTDREPWAQTLKLEPKRVAVMQASFFGQGASASKQKEVENQREVERERRRKEAAISASGASRRDEMMINTEEVASRATNAAPLVDPQPFREFRKYSRVELPSSFTSGKEGNIVDAGLMLGRSFRIGCGPDGRLVHMGALYGAQKASGSDVLTLDTTRLLSESLTVERAAALRILQIQLEHTPIYSDEGSIPFAVTHPELRFSNFTSSDRSTEAHLWRLGHALFDEIEDLATPENAGGELARHIVEIRRRDRLENWLEDVVKGDVEEDLRNISGGSIGAKRVFALLSGHQIERACEAAIESGDLRLATLVAQAGGDDEFREDIYLQLAKWREYRVDSHISNDYRRVYELLCGNVGMSVGANPGDRVDAVDEIHVAKGLDWKRAFGLHLWYGTYQTPISTSVQRYEEASLDDTRVAAPLPSYIERPAARTPETSMWKSSPNAPRDPLFELIRIFTDATHPLESALLPRNFGSSPLDYRLPWHLYILFSRVLRRRDFEDRVSLGEEASGDFEGNSARADLVTESYATQLEQMGLWTWAVFVLLHLELPERRAKSIKEVIARCVTQIAEVDMAFLVENLKIPITWIYAAQAVHAKYTGDIFNEYELHIAAEQFTLAHGIVVMELAPEAVLRNDMSLLRKLFEPFRGQAVSGWEVGGEIFIKYADCVEELKRYQSSQSSDEMLLELILSVPSLFEKKEGCLKLQLAVSEMLSRLTGISSAYQRHANAIQPAMLQETDRLVWLKGLNSAFLQNSLQQAII